MGSSYTHKHNCWTSNIQTQQIDAECRTSTKMKYNLHILVLRATHTFHGWHLPCFRWHMSSFPVNEQRPHWKGFHLLKWCLIHKQAIKMDCLPLHNQVSLCNHTMIELSDTWWEQRTKQFWLWPQFYWSPCCEQYSRKGAISMLCSPFFLHHPSMCLLVSSRRRTQ